ncbi:MAG: hypothetical protein HY313_05695 [Acidobacteria bacterium]|nr:hypothetical protein [Acidobacteriota bacterium]
MPWMSLIFQWINSHVPLLTLVVQALTLAVLAWTLWWVHRYTRAAEKQVDASLEQVEALQKPFLTVTLDELMHVQEVFRAAREQRPRRLARVPDDGLRIYNIGCGPALNISYQLKSIKTGKIMKPALSFSFPHLPPKGWLQTKIDSSSLDSSINRSDLDESENLEFIIQYESLREVSYQTTISILREGATEGPEGPRSNFTWMITRVQMNRIPLVR